MIVSVVKCNNSSTNFYCGTVLMGDSHESNWLLCFKKRGIFPFLATKYMTEVILQR
jgi:hypothetical protein